MSFKYHVPDGNFDTLLHSTRSDTHIDNRFDKGSNKSNYETASAELKMEFMNLTREKLGGNCNVFRAFL